MNYIVERRQEEKVRRRAEILDAAEAVVASVGWDELTMDQVARRARLSRALLYVYFKDKIDLMYGVCERGLAKLRECFDAAAASDKPGLEQIAAVSRAYIDFSQEHPVYFDIITRCELREVNTVDPSANEAACQSAGDTLNTQLVALLDTGVRDGSIRADLGNRVAAAMSLWAFTHGAIQLAFTRAKLLAYYGVDGREVLNNAMAMTMRSLAAKP
jgi:TetR/AcrR family transcriptional regulator